MAAPIPVRYLAPIALAVTLIAVLVVLLSWDGGSGPRDAARSATTERRAVSPRTYVVRRGDTLVSIAERFGLTQERLLALNPTIDAQALQPGMRIRLR